MVSPQNPLFIECRALARETQQNHFPQWAEHDLAECEQFYYSNAELHADRLHQAGEDVHIVTRAVRYLMRKPVPKQFVPWFRERLAVLIDLACPDNASPICGEPFFHDLARGMNLANELGVHRTDVQQYQAVELIEEEVTAEAPSDQHREMVSSSGQ
jgi:hypothetical protein